MFGTAVVTGATGALGRAVVDELVGSGWSVCALGRGGSGLSSLAGERVRTVAVDLSDQGAVRSVWADIDSPAALVALAGAFTPGSIAELDQQALDSLWNANVVSLLWCCQQAAARMSAGGSIVTVGSKTAVTGAAPVAHAATKAAVVRVTELLADELRPQGIRVNCVLPSVIDTPANRVWMPPALAARAVSPASIAKVIAFLVGPDAAPISGARIPVYGDA